MNKKTIAGLIGSALLLVGTQAHAEISWTFDSNPYSGYTTVTTADGSQKRTQTSSGVSVTAQAWANTGGIAGEVGFNGYTNTGAVDLGEVATINGYKLETAYLNVYGGGLGVKNRDNVNFETGVQAYMRSGDYSENRSPEHATDNDQRYDSVLFSFSTDIDLNSVSIGWWDTDSDISVLRYDGDDPGSTTNIAGKTYAQLLTSGWNLVSQASTSVDVSNKTALTTLAGTTGSSYWLIGAANPLLGTSMDGTNDYVKLLAISGVIPKAPPSGNPEPGTLLLMGAGLFGLSRFNARRPTRFAA